MKEWLDGKCALFGCRVHAHGMAGDRMSKHGSPMKQMNNRFDVSTAGSRAQRGTKGTGTQQHMMMNSAMITIEQYEHIPLGSLVYYVGSRAGAGQVIVDFKDEHVMVPMGVLVQAHSTDRPIEQILECGDAWLLSDSERRRLHSFACDQMREDAMAELEQVLHVCILSTLRLTANKFHLML